MNEAGNSAYLALTSTDSLQYFPNNTATRFTTVLNVPLELQGQWAIALRDIVIQMSDVSKQLVGPILFDVFVADAVGAILGGMESTLVCRVCITQHKKGRKAIAARFESCDFVPMRAFYLDRVEVIIKPVFPRTLSFDEETPSYATLVLRKPSAV